MYVKGTLILGLLLLSMCTQAQTWAQIGSTIYGSQYDEFGQSISLSSDGSILAIGAPSYWNQSYVKIFEMNTNGEWEQLGQTIYEKADGEDSGYSVSLSSDGSTIAVGIPKNHNIYQFPGYVSVYKNINGVWTQIGEDIEEGILSEQYGYSVSLNDDGSIIAIGTQYNGEGYTTHIDQVRVYENIEGIWTQIGEDIDGDSYFDLSSDGSIIAVGDPWSDVNGSNSGTVRVYQNYDGSWVQIGEDINGEEAEELSGLSVSLNSSGSIVAVGAPYNDGNGYHNGKVRIFQNNAGTWTQVGADIEGSFYDNAGYVCLNSSGSVLAVKSPNCYARVYENKNGYWEQLGSNIDAYPNQLGNSICLDSIGKRIAISSSNTVSLYGILPTISNHPSDKINICLGENINFLIQGEYIDKYLWQVSIDNGNTWTNLSDDENLSGSETASLIINTQFDYNNYQFSCIASSYNGSVTSDAAVLILDNESPLISSIHNSNFIEANTNCESILPDYSSELTVSDNCDSELIITQSPEPTTLISGNTNVITLTVTDNLGNSSDVSFNIDVSDNLTPVISCVDNQAVSLQEGQLEYTVSGAEFDPLYTNDNCKIEIIDNNYNYLSTLNGAKLPVGINNIEWKITDIGGNIGYCSFTITVFPSNGFIIYPNPTEKQVFLEFTNSNIRKITISDMTGKQLLEKTTIQQDVTIGMSGFESGIYIISIQTDNEIYISKIFKR